MSDKRYLFRGFHPDEQGDATIVVNGEKVKGEWIYGYYLYSNKTKEHYIVSNASNEFVIPELEYFQSILEVIPETVGQWVTTDKNGRNVFEGDCILHKLYGNGEVDFGEYKFSACDEYECVHHGFYAKSNSVKRYIVNNDGYSILPSESDYIEIIGNKWEHEV